MPKTESQENHLKRLNALPQAISTRFKKGQKPYNLKYAGAPRNKNRQALAPCPDCGKPVIITPGRTGLCFKCAHNARRGQGLRVWKSGYVYIDRGNRPYPLHIQKAEIALGRKLKSTEHVHHVNLHKDDNRNENLLVCDNKYHRFLHEQYARKFAERFTYEKLGGASCLQ